MAIPSVFTAVVRDSSHILVDGGVMRNFPVQEAIDMGDDIPSGEKDTHYFGAGAGFTYKTPIGPVSIFLGSRTDIWNPIWYTSIGFTFKKKMRSICRPIKRTRPETCLPLGLLVSLLLMLPSNVFSQDTLYFENGNFIEGKIKNMEGNLLEISADYGGEDFTIEWDQIKAIYASNHYEIHLSDGTFHFGRMRSVSDSTIHIISNNGESRSCHQKDIRSITEIGQDFRHRFTAGIDIGFGLAKANNLRRYTAHANVGYRADKWHGHASGSALYSFQDETEPIKRLEEHADFHYMLVNDWTIHPSVSFLTSTEQKLSLRSSPRLGIGKYIIREKHGYWSIAAGANLNMERFTNETPGRNSMEGYFGTDIKLIKLKDLDLFTKAMAFPSFTESGRWRFDFNAILKYHLPRKFYINTKFTLNYDNQPAEGAGETDYVLHLGLGWGW